MVTITVLDTSKEIIDVSTGDTVTTSKMGLIATKDVAGLVVGLIYLLEHL